MKKRSLLSGFLAIFIAGLFLWIGCKTGTEGGEEEGPPAPPPPTTKLNIHGEPVFNYCYIEVNETDPRVVMGYELEDGTPFFDAVVIFASNIKDQDCAALTAAGLNDSGCTRTGIHIHHNYNIETYFANVEKYIRPIQARGIKVLMGLLGGGGGYTYGTMGEWPFEASAPVTGSVNIGLQHSSYSTTAGKNPPASWQDAEGNPKYPYDAAVRSALIDQIIDDIVQYGLDGCDFDDEWGFAGPGEYEMIYAAGNTTGWGRSVWDSVLESSHASWNYFRNNFNRDPVQFNPDNPSGSPAFTNQQNTDNLALAKTIAGRQSAEFYIEMREKLNQKSLQTGKEYITTVYEYNYNQILPEEISYKGNTVKLRDYVNFFGYASYGGSRADSYTSGTPRSMWSFNAHDLGHGGNTVRPNWATVATQAVTHAAGDYGVGLFYGLYSRNRYSTEPYSDPGGNQNPPNNREGKPSYFGAAGRMPEEYLSRFSQEVFGQDVRYVGQDYPQDFLQRM
jgi:hypothetical protein